MPIRPRKTRFGSATVGAAMALGEVNPLKKASDAIGGTPKKRLGKVNYAKATTPKPDSRPHVSAPVRKSGFGGVTRKASPSRRKMRGTRRGGSRIE